MKIVKIVNGIATENTYIVTEDGQNALVVDPGEDEDLVISGLEENGLKCVAVLLTHAHFDHCNSAKLLQDGGAQIYMHKKDLKLVETAYNLAHKFGKVFRRFYPDKFVKDGEEFTIAGIDVKVLHTPGHTEGSCCFIIGNVLFSGDTLFNLSIGRTDFPTGNPGHMKKSLAKIFAMKEDYSVFAGHGLPSKLSFEREHNPYA